MVQYLASLACISAAAIWGFAFVVIKDSLTYVSPLYIIAFRFTIAAISFACIFWKKLKKINRKYILKASLIGLFLFLAYLFQTIGCNFTSPGKNAFFTTIYVILVPYLSWIFVRQRPKWFVFLSVFIQIVGIGFLSLSDEKGVWFIMNRGDVLTLICGIFYALQIFFQGFFSQGSDENDPVIYAFLEFVVAGLLAWIFSPFYDGQTSSFTLVLQKVPFEAFFNFKVLLSVLYLGIFSTAISFTLQNIGLKYLKSSIGTILLSFESVFGMLFAILIPVNGVREKLSVYGIIGCLLIFAAIILAQKDNNTETVKNKESDDNKKLYNI